MILFFARYPFEELLNDGMFRRIKEIDSLFEDWERLYVYPEKNTGADYRIAPLHTINDKVASQALDFRYAAHNLHFAKLINEAEVVYAHTTVHSAQYLGPYLETGKVICDAHGVAAEEWLLSGYPSCSRFWSGLEGRLVRDSARIVVVTRAMEDFYREKYALSHSRFIHIPIAAQKKANGFVARESDGPVRVIYAGGTHPWQNVDSMLDAARMFPGDAEFIFLSGDRETFRKKIAERDIPHKVTVCSVPAHEMDDWYRRADFGFVLRDDDPVNNVAFPTKLVEYMHSGVIPVLKTDHLGDVLRYGLAYVTLEDFLRGQLPGRERRMQMARKNLSIVSTMAEEYRQGTKALLSAAKKLSAKGKTSLSPTQYPTCIQNAVFPIFFTCSYVADGAGHSQTLDCAEFPLPLALEFQTPVTLSMLALDVSGRDFVFARPQALFTTVEGDFSGACANPADFTATAWGDMVYRSGWIYFHCPEAPVTRVTIPLEVKLFEHETALLAAPAGGNVCLIKKAGRVLRQEGVLALLRKTYAKGRATARKGLAHYGSETSSILYNVVKTHLPAPLKNSLKGLRNKVAQRCFAGGKSRRDHAPAPVDVLVQVDNFLAGGLENVVIGQMDAFRNAGIPVALLVLGQPGEAVHTAERLGLPVYIASYSESGYAKLLEAFNPRLLFTHYSIRGLKTAAQRGIPVIQVVHNSYMWFTEQERAEFLASARDTDLFIAVSQWTGEYSVKRLGVPAEKVHVIENGIDLQRFHRPGLAEEGKKLREDLGFSGEDVVFLSVAAITQQKNPSGLVRAFHAAAPSCPNAKLALLGPIYDRPLYQAVMQYCAVHDLQDKVVYLGAAPDPAPYYAMADIFVHAAFFEGGQLSLLEALAMDLPCVSTKVGFCMNREEQPGLYLCPPPVDFYTYEGTLGELAPTDKSIEDLAACMCKAYDERKRPSLSKREVEKLDRNFSYGAYVEKISPLMKK